jgi:nucleotide-binding universal stress UspA family protein
MAENAAPQFRLVVGFDGSDGSRRALVWAADEASRRSARLDIVRAWTPGEFGTHEEMGMLAQKRLEEDVADVLGPPLTGQVVAVAAEGHAARVLLQHAHDADMLVVGSRGHGGFTGLLLGSVGVHVATHDSAPVVVIVRR